MKVCITNKYKTWKKASTGKGLFVKRLITEFSHIGIEVTADPSCEVDIHLGIGKFEHKVNCKKRILRLGDCHKDINENYKLLNKRKIKAVKRADGVIYQSKYSKKLCNAFLGKAKCPTAVILNGADPNEFDVEPYESPYKYNLLASTRKWTPNKRLKIIKKAYWNTDMPDSCLWVCGDTPNKPEYIRDEKTKQCYACIGVVKPKVLASLYKLCDVMIDVTYLSACPNNVVEAFVAGCPVIHTDQGGTNEVVGFNGYCIKDKPYKYTPINLNKPPKVSIETLSSVIRMAPLWEGKETETFVENLHIQTIAQQYKSFFEEILRG